LDGHDGNSKSEVRRSKFETSSNAETTNYFDFEYFLSQFLRRY